MKANAPPPRRTRRQDSGRPDSVAQPWLRAALARVAVLGLIVSCGVDATGPRPVRCAFDPAVPPLELVSAVDFAPPSAVEVLPVFFIPSDQAGPTAGQRDALEAHLAWARDRFTAMLDDRSTFRIAGAPVEFHGALTLDGYRSAPESGAPTYVGELLSHFGSSRFNTPYVFLVVLMNPEDDFPVGGGRPINGGFDTGGGIIVLSSYALDREPYFQSTLRHELGHAFGLPHVDVYGFDMETNPSIMSYKLAHRTDGFTEAPEPGELIAEDVRGLALNDRALPGLTQDSADAPSTPIVWLGPMSGIPGQPEAVVVARTPDGELFGSSVANAVQGVIPPSAGPGVTFDASRMWSSDTSVTGVVSVVLDFPMPVGLDRVVVHSEHSGLYHRAEGVEVEAAVDGQAVVVLDQTTLPAADASVSFPRTTARRWCLAFETTETRMLVLRGLEFFDGDTPVFPPFVPARGTIGIQGR